MKKERDNPPRLVLNGGDGSHVCGVDPNGVSRCGNLPVPQAWSVCSQRGANGAAQMGSVVLFAGSDARPTAPLYRCIMSMAISTIVANKT
jgi:hypothetical protein